MPTRVGCDLFLVAGELRPFVALGDLFLELGRFVSLSRAVFSLFRHDRHPTNSTGVGGRRPGSSWRCWQRGWRRWNKF